MKNIKKYLDRIYYTYVFNIRVRKQFIIIPIFTLSIFGGWLYGYKFRDNVIINLNDRISNMEVYKDSIIDINDSLIVDLIELDSLKEDGDFYRYLAFKHAEIYIPKKINEDDIKLMHKMAKKYNIPFKYIYRLIHKESRYNPSAKSHVGASGYMQVMPKTFAGNKKRYEAKYGSINHLDQNKQNILVGTFYIDFLYKKYKRWDLTFAAYNAGCGNIEAAGNRIPNIPETQAYVKYIMRD